VLHIGDPDARVIDEGIGGGQPLVERRHARHRFQRVLWADQPPDFVQIQKLERGTADKQVTFMGGVERAAEQADPAARRKGQKSEIGCQGRV
jgi:hypothetical protein